MSGEGRGRVWLPALMIALTAAIVIAGAGALLLRAGLRHSEPILTESTRTGAAAVGTAVAGQLGRALDLGIPLDRLVGVEAHLGRIVAGSPQVSGMALLDAGGRVIAATGEDIVGDRFPVGNGTRATLVVAADSPLFDHAMTRIGLSLALASLLAGALAGVLTAGFLAMSQEPARRRLGNALENVAAGDFSAARMPEARGSFLAAAQALGRRVERVEAARSRLAGAVATIRAIDFDGSLGRPVEDIARPVEQRYILPARDEDETAERPVSGPAAATACAALLAGLYGASFPLVANFAVDRGSFTVPTEWLPVLPLLAELVLLAAGAMLGRSIARRWSGLRLASLLVLGVTTAATFWCRAYDEFVVLRSLAGLATGLVVAGLPVRRAVPAVIVFAGLVAAPLVAGLLGEAVGRRSAFLVLGVLVLMLSPVMAGLARAGESQMRKLPRAFDWATALVAAPAGAMLLVQVPTGVGYDNYLAGGAVAALLGFGVLAGLRLPPLAGATAAMAAAAALVQPLPIEHASAILAAIGIGAALGSAAARAGNGFASAACAGVGVGLAASGLIGDGDALMAALAALAALGLLARHVTLRRTICERG